MKVSIILILFLLDGKVEVRTAAFKNNKACETYKKQAIENLKTLKVADYRVECLEDTVRE